MTKNINAGNSSSIRLARQSSAPGAPATGFVQFYIKDSDGKPYVKDSTGVESGLSGATSLHGLSGEAISASPAARSTLYYSPTSSHWTDVADDVVVARKLGVKADDLTDDTTALQNAIVACQSGSGTQYKAARLLLPNSRMKVGGTLYATNMQGFVMEGGGLLSEFDWYGNSTDPLLRVESCGNAQFRGWGIVRNGGALAVGIQQYALASGGHVTATGNTYDHIWMDGGGLGLGIGWLLSGPVDVNNDFTAWIACNVGAFTGAGWHCVGFECYQNVWIQCGATGGGPGTTPRALWLSSATGTWIGGSLNAADWAIQLDGADGGGGLTIRGLVSETCGGFLQDTVGCQVTGENIRYAANAMDATARILIDAGNMTGHFVNCQFGQGGSTSITDMHIPWNGGLAGLQFVDCTFEVNDPVNLHTTLFPSEAGSTLRCAALQQTSPFAVAALPETYPHQIQSSNSWEVWSNHRALCTANSTPQTISSFTQTSNRPWAPDQTVTLDLGDYLTTLASGSGLLLQGGRPWHPGKADRITLQYDPAATAWRERGRSRPAATGTGTPPPGALALWEAETLGVADGAAWTSWTDSIGGVVLTGVNSPTLDVAGINGCPAANFTPSSSYAENTATSLLGAHSAYTVFVVGQSGDANGGGLFTLRRSTPYAGTLLYSDGTQTYLAGDGVNGSVNLIHANPRVDMRAPFLGCWRYDASSTPLVWWNGALLTTAAATQATESGSTGIQVATNASNLRFAGRIAAIVVISGAVSDGVRLAWLAYLNTKYGIYG